MKKRIHIKVRITCYLWEGLDWERGCGLGRGLLEPLVMPSFLTWIVVSWVFSL